MSRLDNIMNEMTTEAESANEVEVVGGTNEVKDESIAVDETATSNVESSDETPQSSETVDHRSSETVDSTLHQKGSSDNSSKDKDSNKSSIKPSTDKSSTDKSKYTPEQKAEYGFKKRLDRERKKYESQMLELKKQLEALQNPSKNQPKTREDFSSDEEYVKDYFGNMINDAFAKRDAEYRKREEMMNAQARVMESFANQVERDFGSMDEYNNVVENSLEAGLSELIENNPVVKQFIQQSDNSAKVLYKLATEQDAVNKVFGSKTEWDMFYNLKRLEESAETQVFNKSDSQQVSNKGESQQVNNVNPAGLVNPASKPAPVKPIGKVGGQGGNTNENWDDRNWLMKQIRGR